MPTGKIAKLSTAQQQHLLQTLQARFDKNKYRHPGIEWKDVQAKLEANDAACLSLQKMEDSGGEPDVVLLESEPEQFTFIDCSAETPTGRRSLCYDNQALDERKENKPVGSALAMADAMGVMLLDELQYRQLQTFENFDTKTSSWLLTPTPIRKLGGAIFGDKRYQHVFVYHNGAQSYYAARGFRALLKL